MKNLPNNALHTDFTNPSLQGSSFLLYIQNQEKELKDLLKIAGSSSLSLFSSRIDSWKAFFLSLYLKQTREKGKTHFFVWPSSCLAEKNFYSFLEDMGCFLSPIPCNIKGQIDIDLLAEQIHPRTAAISFPWIDLLTGVVQPGYDIVELCKQKKIPLHIDASLILETLDLPLSSIEADFISLSFLDMHSCGLQKETLVVAKNRELLHPSFKTVPSFLAPWACFVEEGKKRATEREYVVTEVVRLKEILKRKIENLHQGWEIGDKEVEQIPQRISLMLPHTCAQSLSFTLFQKGIDSIESPYLRSLLKARGLLDKQINASLVLPLKSTLQEKDVEHIVMSLKKAAEHLLYVQGVKKKKYAGN